MNYTYSPPRARELRALAREALENNWPLAVLVTFLAGILGGQTSFPGSNINIEFPSDTSSLEGLDSIELNQILEQFPQLLDTLTTLLIPVLISTLMFSLVFWLIGPCIHWGLCRFRLALVDKEKPSVGMLFSGFSNVFFKALGVQLVQSLIVLLCMTAAIAVGVVAVVVLIFVPGIELELSVMIAITCCLVAAIVALVVVLIITYRYSMSFYILVDNPVMDIMSVLRESSRMMKGNKWKLFCLQFSFIGWMLLCLPTCGLSAIFLTPYTGQAEAVFYHHVSGRAAIREAVEELAEISEGL